MPAGLAVPEASRLWVDVLGAQPLEVSRSEGEALAAQTHTAHGVCEDGWMVPAPQWKASPSRPSSGRWRTLRAFARGGQAT